MAKAKKKARIGRPPVADEDRRATMVRVLTTENEHAELQRAAEAASMSVSTWIRSAALEKARRGRT
jgi:mobilization protein NikA